ncbi:MAG: hypothetical protein IT377_22655 [Polyangiaceae bacterium]|nr:hypothetical protein [Polyangiaceae bacterium]
MDDDEREWKQAMYERAVADPALKGLAWTIADNATAGDAPPVNAGDMAAARRYLRTCMMNMSSTELPGVTTNELAGLLARGALGAARHRTRAGVPVSQQAGRLRRRPRRAL